MRYEKIVGRCPECGSTSREDIDPADNYSRCCDQPVEFEPVWVTA